MRSTSLLITAVLAATAVQSSKQIHLLVVSFCTPSWYIYFWKGLYGRNVTLIGDLVAAAPTSVTSAGQHKVKTKLDVKLTTAIERVTSGVVATSTTSTTSTALSTSWTPVATVTSFITVITPLYNTATVLMTSVSTTSSTYYWARPDGYW